MLYTIKNEALKVVIDNHGAELHSIQTLDGTEYLWQGDPAVWNGQAPNLFPYVARLTDQKYTFEGKEYSMRFTGLLMQWICMWRRRNGIGSRSAMTAARRR